MWVRINHSFKEPRRFVNGSSPNAMRMEIMRMLPKEGDIAEVYRAESGGTPVEGYVRHRDGFVHVSYEKGGTAISSWVDMKVDPKTGRLYGDFKIRTYDGIQGPFPTEEKARAAAIQAIKDKKHGFHTRDGYVGVEVTGYRGRFDSEADVSQVLRKKGTRTYILRDTIFYRTYDDLPTLNPDGTIRTKGKPL